MTLRSADITAPPVIDPNVLGHPDDVTTSTGGAKISREILNQSAMARYLRKEHVPGPSVSGEAALGAYARQYGRTYYHPAGTCRMGGDARSVVGPQLRVRGVEGLRIGDSSIMPRIVSSNTNAASIMIAEKASALSLGNACRLHAGVGASGRSSPRRFSSLQKAPEWAY